MNEDKLLEEYRLLVEMPNIMDQMSMDNPDDIDRNMKVAKRFVKDEQNTGETITYNGIFFKFYKIKNYSNVMYLICNIDGIYYLGAMFSKIDVDNEGISFTGIWNLSKFKGLIRFVYFNYLNKYKFIQSEDIQRLQGVEMWKKLIAESLKNGYDVTIYDSKTSNEIPVTTSTNLSNYWGKGKWNLLFRIYAK